MTYAKPAVGLADAVPVNAESVKRGRPLCVDLDGSLLHTDLLVESVMALLSTNFLYLFLLPYWFAMGKAYLKSRVAALARIDVSTLPYNNAVLDYIRAQRLNRPIILVTASDRRYAEAIANHLGLFDAVYASDGHVNLKGASKAEKLRRLFGERNFDYIGNSAADIAVWALADTAIVVNARPGVKRRPGRSAATVEVLDGPRSSVGDYIRALRLHQWVKNALVFLPLVLDHRVLEPKLVGLASLAFLAFGLCASGVYLLNDLLDLQADRRHPSKRARPFASGRIDIWHGVVMIPALLALAFTVAFLLSAKLGVILAVYLASTAAYSFRVKRMVFADVLLLAWLYTLRIIAGVVAVDVANSFWLLAFSMFLFLSLALVKRYVEIEYVLQNGGSKAAGRGYKVVDLKMLAHFGVTSGYMAVLVLALYINSEAVRQLYVRPEVIWALCPIMLYFVSRIWLLAQRGEVEDDPVVFALRDGRSQLLGVLVALVLVVAAV
jgi:4-hydroxybenzoate polyprenyltransferase/phosphoserine phosphatase